MSEVSPLKIGVFDLLSCWLHLPGILPPLPPLPPPHRCLRILSPVPLPPWPVLGLVGLVDGIGLLDGVAVPAGTMACDIIHVTQSAVCEPSCGVGAT